MPIASAATSSSRMAASARPVRLRFSAENAIMTTTMMPSSR